MSDYIFTVSKKDGALVLEPVALSVTKAPAVLEFQLLGSAGQEYEITGYTADDEHGQLGKADISADGTVMTVSNSNTVKETINLAVTLENRQSKQPTSLFPTVENEPPT